MIVCVKPTPNYFILTFFSIPQVTALTKIPNVRAQKEPVMYNSSI